MACNCGAIPAPQEKHSYLIHLLDARSARWGRIIVQSPCTHDLQEWLTSLAAASGGITVTDKETEEKFTMYEPRVMKIDPRGAAHVPLVDPV
jgi:hypothetical protein